VGERARHEPSLFPGCVAYSRAPKVSGSCGRVAIQWFVNPGASLRAHLHVHARRAHVNARRARGSSEFVHELRGASEAGRGAGEPTHPDEDGRARAAAAEMRRSYTTGALDNQCRLTRQSAPGGRGHFCRSRQVKASRPSPCFHLAFAPHFDTAKVSHGLNLLRSHETSLGVAGQPIELVEPVMGKSFEQPVKR
jgi:hypothetical protein